MKKKYFKPFTFKNILIIITSVILLLAGCSSAKKQYSSDDFASEEFGSGVISEDFGKSEKKSKKKKEKKEVKKKQRNDEELNLDEEFSLDETSVEKTEEEPQSEEYSQEDFENAEDLIGNQKEENLKEETPLSENEGQELSSEEEEAIAEEERRKAYDTGWQPKKETRYERALRKEQEKENKRKAKEEAKKQKHQKKDPYTGWLYIPKHNFKVQKGDILLSLRGNSGTFGLYAIPESGSKRALLTTSDDFGSTFFALRMGRQEYQLKRESGVICESRETDYGAQLAYKVKNKFQFVVDFSLMPSIATSSRVDVIRVTLYTTNLSRTTQSFAAKAVFDTMLGENTQQHFSTAARSRINSEVQFTDMSVDRWIRSSNDKASVQFLLNGKGISKPKSVSLANKDILSAQANWELTSKEQRSFSSVLAYNNSAVGINWRTAYLDPLKTDVITFYIAVSTDDREPAGRELITNLEKGITALPAAMPETSSLTDVASMVVEVKPEETVTEYHDNMPVISGDPDAVLNAPVTDGNLIIPSASPAAASSVQPSEVIPDAYYENTVNAPQDIITAVPVNVVEIEEQQRVSAPPIVLDDTMETSPVRTPPAVESQTETYSPQIQYITKKQYDPEYVQDLLDRIAELENDEALVDRAEINRLNAELDLILSELRSME